MAAKDSARSSSSACSLLFSVSSVLKQMHSHGSVGVGIVLVLDLGWGFTVNEFTEEVYRRIFPFQAHQRSQYINPVAEPEPSFGRRFFDPRYRVPSAEPEPSFYLPQPEPFSSIPLLEPEPEPCRLSDNQKQEHATVQNQSRDQEQNTSNKLYAK